jgi:uncharacterized membrane protein YeaQ/YmgE (transglycosylase-associated protein family)
MIGMSFPSFIVLLLIGVVCAFVFHTMLQLKVFQADEGFKSALIVAWIGAWLGSPGL